MAIGLLWVGGRAVLVWAGEKRNEFGGEGKELGAKWLADTAVEP